MRLLVASDQDPVDVLASANAQQGVVDVRLSGPAADVSQMVLALDRVVEVVEMSAALPDRRAGSTSVTVRARLRAAALAAVA